MATVHIGRLLGPVGFARTIAIKRLHSHFAGDPEFVSMLLDEARLAARVRHPNVVSVVDVVVIQGELLLVMDYVEGESLARLEQQSRETGTQIPPPVAVTMMAGVLYGLHAAHEARGDRGEPLGIVHRDVSPQNVLVGVDGVARVVDFGVAMAVGRVQTTREGQLKGKLAYMAPEQIRGNVSRATDVYAASVVLWETLTGRRLFSGSEVEVFAKVMEQTVEAPSRYAPAIPPALDALVLRGLSRDPSSRFATAREMARALEDVVPPVALSKIGEWVEKTARDAVAHRARLVEHMESSSIAWASAGVAPDLPQAGSGAAARPTTHIADSTTTGELVITKLSSSSGLPLRRPSRRSVWRNLVVFGALAGMAGLGGCLALAWSSSRSQPPSIAQQSMTANLVTGSPAASESDSPSSGPSTVAAATIGANQPPAGVASSTIRRPRPPAYPAARQTGTTTTRTTAGGKPSADPYGHM